MDAETITMLTGLLGAIMAFVVIGAALGGAWLLGRGWHRRGDARGERLAEELNSRKIEELMTRIEDLALEVERSAELQRFLAKTLASGVRAEPIAVPNPMLAPERVVTPH
jgi:hypothetical protein